jgi:phosphoribosylaminoimidazolecarboxamide formyltransferase/IMP cyclohydrolase
MKKTALLSVWDKTGLATLAEQLIDHDWQLLATGGTARHVEESHLPVTRVEEITGEPELFQGRVKTLHPALHAGILAPDQEDALRRLEERSWPRIDLVVINLYPFQEAARNPESSLEQVLEQIDIGGAALLRAGAKNYSRVTVLTGPEDYPDDLSLLDDLSFRRKQAGRAFQLTAGYDRAVHNYLEMNDEQQPSKTLELFPAQPLRYGENPHQRADFYPAQPGGTPFNARVRGKKGLSYNNLLDLEGAWRAVQRFEEPAAVVVKHTSPCGIAQAGSPAEAFALAAAADPVSAFGSVIAVNRKIGLDFVNALGDLFVECLAAPEFSPEAAKLLAKTSVRLVEIPDLIPTETLELRSIPGGYLEQASDPGSSDPKDWEVVTSEQPGPEEWSLIRFAWRSVIDLKSNAVLLARGSRDRYTTVGIGSGQPNRVDCLRIAGRRAGEKAADSVLASEAFFPFPDTIRLAARLGVRTVIQPGGSRRDPEVIAEADRQNLPMIFTGRRHFRH